MPAHDPTKFWIEVARDMGIGVLFLAAAVLGIYIASQSPGCAPEIEDPRVVELLPFPHGPEPALAFPERVPRYAESDSASSRGAYLTDSNGRGSSELGMPAPTASVSQGRLSFNVTLTKREAAPPLVRTITSPFPILSAFVMPKSTLVIEVESQQGGGRFEVVDPAGDLIKRETSSLWVWRAPDEPGVYELSVEKDGADESALINVFVLTPYAGGDVLDGFRVGAYPSELKNEDQQYRAPPGLFAMTARNQATRVSPHLEIQQFRSYQRDGYPRFLIVDERLILKLEYLIEALAARGIEAQGYHLLSGFRSPHSNAAGGRTTTYSHHLWGRAADIIVDQDNDRVTDDLNGDGTLDAEDAKWLRELVLSLSDEPWYADAEGGLGVYPSGFLHMDVGGWPGRWE